MPPSSAITLDQRKIFILPTKEGILFSFLIVFMVIAGINYQNSLIFALAFLLASLFMVSILHTYRNLSGLTIMAGGTLPAFAGEDAEFTVVLSRFGVRTYEALLLGWNIDLLLGADLLEDEEVKVKLFVETRVRGLMNPGRMLIQTYYPVGLFRAWSWLDLDMKTIVYPRPVPAGAIPFSESTSSDGELIQREGVDDFYGLRDYQQGDPLKHVAWKSYARTDELLTKQFAAFADRRVWLEWDFFPGMDKEARLSRLCHWVLKLDTGNDEYGLRLPGVEIAPGRGPEHREEMLKTLALFEVEQGS
jgi:uncharacterized protein (DUF58 family)|tara:strand:- start:13921 stop:14832 length:912 start_codon:yes stop_codon:yes gene_type:complete